MKKKVYIISHSHLDREWYMPFEQHHMRVVELFDALIDVFEHDPSFKYFHVDGQTIPLDDYLEVKPENRPLIEKYIKEGKLRIGPFYILQDDFLISPEAHVRNTLIGLDKVEKYGGKPVRIGYFPDTFGNMGQTAQMMKKMGLDSAAFGRGVKPTGLNNQVSESYTSQYSEMNWQGPDGSKILGVLFANWYSNGNEIPATKDEAVAFWTKKLAEAEKYASTDHLLMMNGCDHQPLQRNVGQAIALANELFPDYEFIHSNFDDYLKALKEDLPEDLGTVTGELTSQETDGWYTLANTASSRMYLKKENVTTEVLLGNLAEPLVALTNQVEKYDAKSELGYAWRLLLQNDPHDSICGCSVDAVHQEMMTRYHKAQEVAKFVRDESLDKLSKHIDYSAFPESSKPFTVYNFAGTNRALSAKVKIEFARKYFSEAYPDQAFQAMEELALPEFSIVDSQGQEQRFSIDEVKTEFGYDLPKDAFRVPYMSKNIYLTLYLPAAAALSYASFALVAKASQQSGESVGKLLASADGRVLENDYIKAEITEQGDLTVTQKKTGKTFNHQLVFEDVGDIGNEYIFKQSADGKALYSTDFPYQIELLKNTDFESVVRLIHHMEIPVSADERLQREQEAVIDITHRQSERSKETAQLDLITDISLKKDAKMLEFETTFDNKMKNHRLRVLFQTDLITDGHTAESIFEAVKRPNTVGKYWKNPSNPQHQQAFVNLNDGKNGLTVGNVALNEYEILDDKTIAVTLLRAVGEMGDWGYFPTEDSQCLGAFETHYSLMPHDSEELFESYQQALALRIPALTKQANGQDKGELPSDLQFVKISSEAFALTSFKQAENKQDLILRGYSLNNEHEEALKLSVLDKSAKVVDLLEKDMGNFNGKLGAAEILTTKWSTK